MGNQPWLDALSDDWVSQPRSPSTPGFASSFNLSRRSSLRNSPSRIPVPARNSPTPQKPTPDEKKKVPRPCHFIKREVPSPRTPSRFKTPVKKTPAKDGSRTGPKQSQDSGGHRRQSSTPSKKKPPLRSASNASNASIQTVQHNTVQRMSGKESGGDATPEWRKRLVRGEVPAGEQCDLFAPIGLESVFKPPTPGSEAALQETFAFPNQTDSLWAFTENGSGKRPDTTEGNTELGDRKTLQNKQPDPMRAAAQHNEQPDANSPDSDKENRNQGNDARDGSPSPNYNHESLSNGDVRLRTVSGLEELRNEGITPIFLSRNNTVEGKATSEIVQSALQRLNNKLEKISLNNRNRPGSRASDSGVMYQQSDEEEEDRLPEDDLLEVTSQSLPKDLSMGTLDFAARGAFVNLRRGGYSNDGSFQTRHLTPSSFPSQLRSPSMLTDSKIRSSPPPYELLKPSREKSAIPSDAPSPPAVTLTPARESRDHQSNSAAMYPSGSPLKLFGNHDTFTNNKLLRRMSQFEETFGDISEEDEPPSPTEGARRKGRNRSRPNSRREPQVDHSPQPSPRPRSQDAVDDRMNRFGNGQLDHFGFSDRSPDHRDMPRKIFEDSMMSPSYSLQNSSPHGNHRRGSQQESLRKSKNSDSIKNSRSSNRQRISSWNKSRNSTEEGLRYLDNPEVKRALNTPTRTSTPKRRRTLQKAGSPGQDYEETLDLVTDSMGSMSLLQRSLIRQGLQHESERTGLQVPAIRRPRTPTPSQARSNRDKQLLSDRDGSGQDENPRSGQRKAGTVPKNMGALRTGAIGAMEETRKGSITTQDFLDEATKIMSIIRANGRAKNGLASVEESDMASQDGEEGYPEESTQEEFSRPPSRNGVDMRKLREDRPQNPRIVSHLKKFEERDEPELVMSGSVTSLHLEGGRNARLNSPDAGQDRRPNTDDEVESSPKNIRIRENPFMQRKRKHSGPNSQDGMTMDTQASSNSSSERSIPTRSSNSSNAKGVIPSDVVSHLIPELVNGMTYDRSTNMWVKKSAEQSRIKSRVDDSEDDPFQDIPDLSVDELQELMRIHELTSAERTKDTIHSPERGTNGGHASSETNRPQTRDGDPSLNASSVQSKITRFTASGPKTDTRATSWSTDELAVKPTRRAGTGQHSKEVEHEIHLHEGLTSTAPQRQEASARQPRVVTISFSSPLVSHVAYPENPSPTQSDQNAVNSVTAGSRETTRDEPHPLRQSRHNSGARAPSRRTSLDGRPFVGRSISRIDEQNEESTNNLSLIHRDQTENAISTPALSRLERSLTYPRSADNDTTYSFHLSPLPDFTVHQIDDPLHLELSYVAQRTHSASLRQVHGTFALAAEDLIKHITDVEPYEPYWDDIRRLDLSKKGLITLHRLNEFCPRLEELDASDNDIGQLSGAPPTIRHLRIQRNCLSSLTAWGHLINLQYLDVSGNELDSLDGFLGLIHLRELRANNNNIRSIDGILDLDGLLSLKLKNNALTEVDFEGAELTRLKEVDLSNNQLTSVRNIASLPSLEALDLTSNRISDLHSTVKLRNLHSLRLSDNCIRTLDVSIFPSLNLLYLDKNFLSMIDGLGKCYQLEVLSAREQSSQEVDEEISFDLDLSLLKDARKIFLSSNRLSPRTLCPSVPLPSVQLLDIASCALHSLPVDFASHFPNLRVLNLNFNALADVGEIMGMKCLGRLTLAGNRITRLRRLCQVLGRVGRANGSHISLKRIDLRGNPLTVGFYPPAISGSGRSEAKAKELKAKEETRRNEKGLDENGFTARANFGGHEDIARLVTWRIDGGGDVEPDVEIDDPFTLPPADAEADRKYLSHLDESTKLRRRVVELMLYAGTGGAIKVLDGLELRSSIGEEGSDINRAWCKLEELGVLKKRGVLG